jgi:ubiquinol-cytochrome c reductase cytochrome c1 subunit
MNVRTLALAGLLAALPFAALAEDLSLPLPPKDVSWSFEGPTGIYDRAALQRGFQVYKEVCSACHSLNRIAFNDLISPPGEGGGGLGGVGFSAAQAKAIAAGYKIPADPNDKGEIFDDKGNRLMRAGILADHFPPPFANEQAARASNNGALPPDLSLIVKAREGGPQYVYSILTGFGQKAPAGFKVQANMYYNPYFAGRNIAMPPPLTDGTVTFSDGTPNNRDQEAHDVVTFLAWASEPKLEERHSLGLGVMAFMVILSGLLFLSYRRVWKDAH